MLFLLITRQTNNMVLGNHTLTKPLIPFRKLEPSRLFKAARTRYTCKLRVLLKHLGMGLMAS